MAEKKKLNYFEELNNINVQDKIEKKGNLSYLSWAFAWEQLKIKHPKAQYKVYERENGINYWTDDKTAWVKVSVTVDDIEHIEYLPIMDYRNKSISVSQVSSFNVNTSIQRAVTKAIARHGLGLYIYAGEDIPSAEKDDILEEEKKETKEKEINKKLSKVFDDDMKEVMKNVNKNTAEEMKNAINECKSKDAVDEKYLEYKSDMAKLYKYDISLFNEVKEFKENVKSLLQ
jgi:hypothetical protein